MNSIRVVITRAPVSVFTRSMIAAFRLKGVGRLTITESRILPGGEFWKCNATLVPSANPSAREFVRALKTGQPVHMYYRTIVAWSGNTYTPGEPYVNVSMTDGDLERYNPRAAEKRKEARVATQINIKTKSSPPGLPAPVLWKTTPVPSMPLAPTNVKPTDPVKLTDVKLTDPVYSSGMYLTLSHLLSTQMAEYVLADPPLNLNDMVRSAATPIPLDPYEFNF